MNSWRAFRTLMWALPVLWLASLACLPFIFVIDSTALHVAILLVYSGVFILFHKKLLAMRCANCKMTFLRGARFPFSRECRSCGKPLRELLREERKAIPSDS